jgi:hypothetical protein
VNRKEKRALAKLKPGDIKIGTKEQAVWIEVQKKTEQLIEAYEKEIMVNKAILELAINKIEIEKKKMEE